MDKICLKLGISAGSASQGLRTLRKLKAIKPTYIQGERKDHYVAETEFRRLFSNFIKEEILPHMDSADERIKRLEINMEKISEDKKEFYSIRIEKLKRLTRAVKDSFRL